MVIQKPLKSVVVAEGLGAVLVLVLAILFVIEEMPDMYLVAGLGVFPTIIPLFAIAKRVNSLKSAWVTLGKYYLITAAFSITATTMAFMAGDPSNGEGLLGGGLLLLVTCMAWYVTAYTRGWHRDTVHNLPTYILRACIVFLLVYFPAYLFYVPARLVAIGVTPVIDSSFDILFGITVMCFLIFAWATAKHRIAFFNALILLGVWYELETGWIMRNADRLEVGYVGTIVFAIGMLLVLVLATGFSLGRFIGETALHRKSGHSVLLGSWFSPLLYRTSKNSLDPRQKKAVKRGLLLGGILFAIAMPGFIVYFNWIQIPVVITPRTDYTMRFNFWASSNLSLYSPEVQQELNDHQANLDLGADFETLEDFEYAMPNITYRVTISPSNFSLLLETVIERTELFLEYEDNETLDQWRGYAFDIEGHAYSRAAFKTVDEVIAEWNATFDYVYNNASVRRGKIIEMENVGNVIAGADAPFDGDLDTQVIEGYVSNMPDRFTTYAPMIYRCMTDDSKCTTAPAGLFDRWATSYNIYQNLYALNGTLRNESRLGIYLGITNCSCYSRDLPQPEPVTWGESGGFQNLIRDTLIAKHFGVPEVTYFLQFSIAIQDCNCLQYGAFDSYGTDFLDVMNDSVNTNPPSQFTIYYNHQDSDANEFFYRDLLGDVSRPSGAIFVIGAALGAIIFVFISEKRGKKAARGEKPS